jgi:putative transposase
MARPIRHFEPGIALHVVQRGNNRNVMFRSTEDYRAYLTILLAASKAERCAVHAFVLMTNHSHLLITPQHRDSTSRMMKWLHQEYAQLHNRKYARTGGLYEGRFRASLVETDRYFLLCQRYIEMNPVRAEMVAHPADYRWSSYRINASRVPDDLVTPHPIVEQFSPAEYQSMFSRDISAEHLAQVRSALNSNRPFGNEEFTQTYSKSFRKRGV